MKTTTPTGATVTVLAKVMLDLVPNEATLAAPLPLVQRDTHADGDAERGVVKPCETSPRLMQPEIVLVRAVARQLGGQGAPSRAVSLAVYREQTPLLTKMLHVHGDRRAASRDDVKPFTEMPVEWSRSRFEPSVNPFGVQPTDPRLPNVVAPLHPNAPASFEPIARRTPWRKSLLGAVSAATADGLEPSLPVDFNWEYYQCSTRDQRVAGFSGTEWIVIDGMTAEVPRLQSRLPGLVAKARVYAKGVTTPIDLPLAIDLVIVDVSGKSIAIISRGHAPFTDGMRVTVTVEGGGVAADWPNPPEVAAQEPKLAYASSAAASAAPTMETAHLSDRDQRQAAEQKPAPFAIGAPKGPSATPAPAPWVEAAKPVVPATVATPSGPAVISRQTIAITAADLEAPPAPAPVAPPAPAPKKETLGERMARGEAQKPAAPEAPAAPTAPGPPVAAPAKTSKRVGPKRSEAPVDPFGVKLLRPDTQKDADKSPNAVAERMWRGGANHADVDAYLAAVKP